MTLHTDQRPPGGDVGGHGGGGAGSNRSRLGENGLKSTAGGMSSSSSHTPSIYPSGSAAVLQAPPILLLHDGDVFLTYISWTPRTLAASSSTFVLFLALDSSVDESVFMALSPLLQFSPPPPPPPPPHRLGLNGHSQPVSGCQSTPVWCHLLASRQHISILAH